MEQLRGTTGAEVVRAIHTPHVAEVTVSEIGGVRSGLGKPIHPLLLSSLQEDEIMASSLPFTQTIQKRARDESRRNIPSKTDPEAPMCARWQSGVWLFIVGLI